MNLFFDGSNSIPGISVFGATNSSNFLSNGASTLTLQGTSVAGSGRSFYGSGGVIVVLSGYDWNSPATPPGDVCQAFVFSPGGGPDYFGSFTLAGLAGGDSEHQPNQRLAVHQAHHNGEWICSHGDGRYLCKPSRRFPAIGHHHH